MALHEDLTGIPQISTGGSRRRTRSPSRCAALRLPLTSLPPAAADVPGKPGAHSGRRARPRTPRAISADADRRADLPAGTAALRASRRRTPGGSPSGGRSRTPAPARPSLTLAAKAAQIDRAGHAPAHGSARCRSRMMRRRRAPGRTGGSRCWPTARCRADSWPITLPVAVSSAANRSMTSARPVRLRGWPDVISAD